MQKQISYFSLLYLFTSLLLLWGDELVALTMDIDDLNLRISLQVLTQFGDIDIHRAGIEVVVVDPDGLQGEVTLQNLVRVRAEQGEQFVLLRGELCLSLTDAEQLLLSVEREATNVVDSRLL